MQVVVSPSCTVLAHYGSDASTSGGGGSLSLRDAATGRWRNTLPLPSAHQAVVQKLLFVDDEHLAILFRSDDDHTNTKSEVTVWDVTRSVVACRIQPPPEEGTVFWDMATDHHPRAGGVVGALFLATTKGHHHHKIVIQEYSITTASGKLQRKIKGAGKTVDHHPPGVRLAVTPQHLVVRSSHDSIRILDRETGSKVAKVSLTEKGKDTATSSASSSWMMVVQGDLGCCSVTTAGQPAALVLFRVSTGQILKQSVDDKQELSAAVMGISDDGSRNLQLVQDDDDDDSYSYWLLLHDKVVAIETEGKKYSCSRTVAIDTAKASSSANITTVLRPNGTLLAVQLGGSSNPNDCKIQTLPLLSGDDDTTVDKLTVSWNNESKQQDENSSKKNKRSAATILGPGQTGGEARGVTDASSQNNNNNKRSRVLENDDGEDEDDDDEDGPTLAERLQQLQQAMDDENGDDDDDNNDMQEDDKDDKFVPQQATTESLTQVLQQALQSGDSPMLELALQVRDPILIRESCRQLLSDVHVPLLLQALTTRLSRKPARAEHLCRWLTALLRFGGMTDSTNAEHLQPLQNLLQERLEVFPMLLQLEGRLARMEAEDA